METIRRQQARGDYSSTIEPLRDLLAERSADAELNYLYGRALFRTQQISLATWPLRRAMEDPDWLLPAGNLLARILLMTRDFNEAVETTTRMLEIHPENATARLYRAQANAHWKKDAEAALADALEVLERAPDEMVEAYEPMILALLTLGRFEEATAALEEAGRRLEEIGAGDEQMAWHCSTTAIFASDAGEFERSRALWEECLEKFPSDATVVSGALSFFGTRGEGARVLEILRRALEQAPTRRDYRVGLAERLRRAGDVEGGEALLRENVESDNPQVEMNAFIDLASFLHADERHGEAAEAFAQAVEIVRAQGEEPPAALLFPYADALVVSGQLDRAVEVAEDLTVPAQRRLILARVAQERGDLEQAIKEFDEALRLWPNNASARYYAGRAAENLGRFDRALEEYRYAVRASVGATDARTRAARLLIAEGRLLRAYQILFVEVDTAPLEPEGQLLSMYLMGRVANPRQLEDGLSRLAVSQPALLPEALVQGAEGLAESLGPDAALSLLTSVKGLDYSDLASAPVLRAIVRTAHRVEEPGVATRFVAEALEGNPEAAFLHGIRGLERELAGDPVGARAAYERALQLDPEEANALRGLGRLAITEDPAGALALFDRAVAMDPSVVESRFAAARALLALGRDEEAARRLDALLQDHPFEVAAVAARVEIDLDRSRVSSETLEMARRGVRFGGGTPAYERLARVQTALGDEDAAEETLAQAQRLAEWAARLDQEAVPAEKKRSSPPSPSPTP